MPARPKAMAGSGGRGFGEVDHDRRSSPRKPDGYWDRAGEQGYGRAMYRSSDVETHVRGRLWQIAIDIAWLILQRAQSILCAVLSDFCFWGPSWSTTCGT